MSNTIRARLESRETHETHKLYKKYKRIGHSIYKNSVFVSPTKKRICFKEWNNLNFSKNRPTKFWIVTPKYELVYTSEDLMGIFLDEQETYVDRTVIQLSSWNVQTVSENVLVLKFKYNSIQDEPCIEFRVVLIRTEEEFIPTQFECFVRCENIQEKLPDSWYSQPVTNWYLFF